LFGYSSPKSQIKNERGLTPADYGAFWKDTDYNAMFEHLDAVSGYVLSNYLSVIPGIFQFD